MKANANNRLKLFNFEDSKQDILYIGINNYQWKLKLPQKLTYNGNKKMNQCILSIVFDQENTINTNQIQILFENKNDCKLLTNVIENMKVTIADTDDK